MPQVVRTDTHTGITAEHERKLRRHAASTGFDPNADPVVIGLNADGHASPRSVAIGTGASVLDPTDPTDTGYEGVAIGADSYAGADGALALGTQASVSAVASIAIGYGTTADGESAVALGPSATAEALDSAAIGHLASATGTSSVAIGHSAHATNDGAVAVGRGAHAQGDHAAAFGDNAWALNPLSTALGDATAQHDHSTALGAGAVTARANQIMVGTDADVAEIPGLGNGIALYSPGGTRYVMSVSNTGTTVWTATP